MRKFILPALASLFFLSSCGDNVKVKGESKEGDMSQKNLEASRAVTKAFQTGDVSLIDSAVADDFVDHTDKGDKVGKDSLKAMVNMVHTNFKDMKTETLKEFGDNDHVFSWMRFTGTSDGSMGMPKGPYDMHTIEVVRFKDGKAVEHWSYMDAQEMMKMMGQSQNMDMGKQMEKNKMDSTKK